jgi:hypothetical protein
LQQPRKEVTYTMASTPSLIPKADQFLANDMNVMLVGLHGVGKTEDILRLVRSQGLKIKYYSCSTLDPYTDLVGIPVPQEDEDGVKRLEMIRPRDIDEAEFIFFDEFNRADAKTLNAIFEIIQFRSINGEPLPNLRCCWAAMNPPGDDYQVEDLDPALVDRFDAFVDVTPKPSVRYMERHLPRPIAQALYSWWSDHNQSRRGIENYVSPRRLMKMGQMHVKLGDFRPALPKWINADRQKLNQLLQRAEEDMKSSPQKVPASDHMGGGPNPRLQYEADWIKEYSATVATYLTDQPDDLETHKAIMDTIQAKHGKTLARDYAEVLDAIKPSIREGFLANMAPGKEDSLKQAVAELPQARKDSVPKLLQSLGL